MGFGATLALTVLVALLSAWLTPRGPVTSVQAVVSMAATFVIGLAVPAQAWFEMLDAPHKEWIVFEHSGHRPLFEEPAAFTNMMWQVVTNSTK